MNCETREQTAHHPPTTTQSETPNVTPEEQLRKKIASKLSEIYNISYDELYKTIASSESQGHPPVVPQEEKIELVSSSPTVASVTSVESHVTLDKFKRDHMKKTLKELKELAVAHNVSIHGTKEKIIEKMYQAIYSDTASRKTKKTTATTVTATESVTPAVAISTNSSAISATTTNVTVRKASDHILHKFISEQDTVETRDIGVDTSDLADIVCDSEQLWFNIQRNMLSGYNMHSHGNKNTTATKDDTANTGVFSKWGDIHTRDILLLLQTHKLSTAGTRDDWIARLKEFYNQIPATTATKPIEWNEDEINQMNEDLISRIDARPSFMKCIASAVPITVYTDANGTKRIDPTTPGKSLVVENEIRYVWIKDRNWVFVEDDSSYEFIGCIIDNVLITCDMPNELLQMNE